MSKRVIVSLFQCLFNLPLHRLHLLSICSQIFSELTKLDSYVAPSDDNLGRTHQLTVAFFLTVIETQLVGLVGQVSPSVAPPLITCCTSSYTSSFSS